jgi:hypothetical protein
MARLAPIPTRGTLFSQPPAIRLSRVAHETRIAVKHIVRMAHATLAKQPGIVRPARAAHAVFHHAPSPSGSP